MLPRETDRETVGERSSPKEAQGKNTQGRKRLRRLDASPGSRDALESTHVSSRSASRGLGASGLAATGRGSGRRQARSSVRSESVRAAPAESGKLQRPQKGANCGGRHNDPVGGHNNGNRKLWSESQSSGKKRADSVSGGFRSKQTEEDSCRKTNLPRSSSQKLAAETSIEALVKTSLLIHEALPLSTNLLRDFASEKLNGNLQQAAASQSQLLGHSIVMSEAQRRSQQEVSQVPDLTESTDNEQPTSAQSEDNKSRGVIVTFLKQNFYNKNLAWQTNLIIESEVDDEFDSDADNESVFEESKPTAIGQQIESVTNDHAAEQIFGSEYRTRMEVFKVGDTKSHLLSCATAAITANFADGMDSSSRMRPPSGHEFSVSSSNYPSFANQPTGSTGEKPSISFSEPYDTTASGKFRPTRRSADQSSSLYVSIENLKLMAERNLVATLVGVYMLISLTVVTVLVLPYVFNAPRAADLDRGISFEPASYLFKAGQILTQDKEQLDEHDARDKPAKVSKSTQTSEIHEDGYNHSAIVSKSPPENQSEQSDSTAESKVNNKVVGAAENDAQQLAAKLPVAEREDTQKSGNRKRSEAQLEDESKLEREAETEEDLKLNKANGYFDSWKSIHNIQCQPLVVPFCSKSFDSMLPNSGASGQQPAASKTATYDKTLMPNQFSQARQSQVERFLQRYEPIVDIKCYALMPLFLCSIYAPKCIQINQTHYEHQQAINHHRRNHQPHASAGVKGPSGRHRSPNSSGSEGVADSSLQLISPARKQQIASSRANATSGKTEHWARLVPPCRSLCREAFRKCMFFFEVLSLKLSEPEDCDLLPESSDPDVCVGQREHEWLVRSAESQSCQSDRFRCSDGECIPKKWRCDGFADCTDRSDEDKCSKCDANSQFYCGQELCIEKAKVCDGIRDCRDGRDERQCLRLTQAPDQSSWPQGPSRGAPVGGARRLEVWSAPEDSWLPVCGLHWSAAPMSHEACQALGYSRANETLILFGPTAGGSEARGVNSSSSLAANGLLAGKQNRAPLASGRESQGSASSDRPPVQLRASHAGSWFGLASGGESHAADGRDGSTDDAQLVDILEDVSTADSATGGRSSRPNRRDHLVSYQSAKFGLDELRSAVQLAAVDADKVKFKSLTSLLFHGPQSGCADLSAHEASHVYLQCQNFQCGRSITSYSTRVRLQQQRSLLSSIGGPAIVKRSASAGSSPSPAPTDDSSSVGGQLRARTLEANEELEDSLWSGAGDGDSVERAESEAGALSLGNDPPEVSARLVVGGHESLPGEFPYLAALHGGPDEVFFCGGVLISINWLLTAAHCVGNRTQPEGWMVKVGVTRRIASPAFVRKLKVRKIVKHPNFNQDSIFNNDIALILLEESVEFNQYLRPICLPRANLKLGPDNSRDCVVVGFGKSKYSQEANYLHVAHFVNVPIVQRSVCSNWYLEHGVNLTEGMLCAGYAEGKRDACQGDSGSGLFCRYSNTNQFFVAGVVSFGIKCANPKLPGVYTSVPLYVDWIEATTSQHGYPLGLS